jgi:RNA polymerase sigma factor (sigma-70 family)
MGAWIDPPEDRDDDVVDLVPLLRKVVSSRVSESNVVDDVVQETLARVLAVRERLDDEALVPYAIVTARNVAHGIWRRRDRDQRLQHRVADFSSPSRPDEELLRREEAKAVTRALSRLGPREREGLLAHELAGHDTTSLGRRWGASSGAVAQQLHRARARLRVEYLIEMSQGAELTSLCRPVLLALSAGDRRRQQELDAGHHLLECDACARLSEELFERRKSEGVTRVRIERDADVVKARQRAHSVARQAGLTESEATMVSTAVSEIARNIVQFAHRGEIVIVRVKEESRDGVTITARDAGPGIADLQTAMADGSSSYGGMGLGLPGARRLMDEFDLVSEVGRGTTVTMTKWRSSRGAAARLAPENDNAEEE